jgi:dihydrolipoamide dehydrogenase
MATQQHDLIIIGAGPGGYVAAIRAAQLGLNVACIEREPVLGGTCLRVGCIPSKALLESSECYHEAHTALAEHGVKTTGVTFDLPVMMQRKDKIVATLTKGVESLFKKNKVTRYTGHARLGGPGKVVVGDTTLTAPHILIATGSKSATLPSVTLDGDRIGTSTEAIAYSEVPGHLVVIGAGVIGLELGSVWKRLGARVTVLEYFDRILPGMDNELATEAKKVFEKQGIEFRLSSRGTSARVEGKNVVVTCDGSEPLICDRVLLAVGRAPNTEGLGLETAGITVDKRGRIEVNDHFQTSCRGIYAIGDVIRGPMLAHKAEEEGIACVERIATGRGHVNYQAIPSVVYTHPEVASVGQTEEELKNQGIEYRKGVFPFLANGRAHALGQIQGKIKVLADKNTDRILGVHIIGSRAGDLIAEATVAMEFSASSEDIARSCHAHPTLAEALKEAALAVDGRALHI